MILHMITNDIQIIIGSGPFPGGWGPWGPRRKSPRPTRIYTHVYHIMHALVHFDEICMHSYLFGIICNIINPIINVIIGTNILEPTNLIGTNQFEMSH